MQKQETPGFVRVDLHRLCPLQLPTGKLLMPTLPATWWVPMDRLILCRLCADPQEPSGRELLTGKRHIGTSGFGGGVAVRVAGLRLLGTTRDVFTANSAALAQAGQVTWTATPKFGIRSNSTARSVSLACERI